MAIHSVFVYADGQIGDVMLPVDTEPSVWRRAIKSGHVSTLITTPVRLTIETEEFDLVGHLFDGRRSRPVYCSVNIGSRKLLALAALERLGDTR